MGTQRWASKDMVWFLGKKAIAYSTRADSDALGLLAEDGFTFAQAAAHPLIGEDARRVCEAFIARGYANARMAGLGVVYR